MPIILVASGGSLQAIDTSQVADDSNNTDPHVGKLVAEYNYAANPDYAYLINNAPDGSVRHSQLTTLDNGDIYATMHFDAFTDPDTGKSYPADDYIVKLVPTDAPPTENSAGVTTYTYTAEPVILEDGSYVQPGNARYNPLDVAHIDGKEYLVLPNSKGAGENSTNLLYDPETGKSTSMMVDTDGDDAPGHNLSSNSYLERHPFELIYDEENDKYYALQLRSGNHNTSTHVYRYEVTVTPNPDDPLAPPVLTINDSSRTKIAYLDRGYFGFDMNDDGSATFYPGGGGSSVATIQGGGKKEAPFMKHSRIMR